MAIVNNQFKIGQVAKLTGLSVKSIRYYHDIGLVQGKRNEAGYRLYSDADINSLNFIHQCRDLGFSLEHCQHLLSLNNNQQRQAENVRQLAIEHLEEVNQKIIKLEKLKHDLEQMIGHCQGGKQSKCAILDGINKA